MVAVRDYSALNTPALRRRGVTEVLVLSSGFIYRRSKGRWVFDRRRDGGGIYPPIIVGRPRQLRLPLS